MLCDFVQFCAGFCTAYKILKKTGFYYRTQFHQQKWLAIETLFRLSEAALKSRGALVSYFLLHIAAHMKAAVHLGRNFLHQVCTLPLHLQSFPHSNLFTRTYSALFRPPNTKCMKLVRVGKTNHYYLPICQAYIFGSDVVQFPEITDIMYIPRFKYDRRRLTIRGKKFIIFYKIICLTLQKIKTF